MLNFPQNYFNLPLFKRNFFLINREFFNYLFNYFDLMVENLNSFHLKFKLSPHLSIYTPQFSSILSILHRISGVFLLFLSFYFFKFFIFYNILNFDFYQEQLESSLTNYFLFSKNQLFLVNFFILKFFNFKLFLVYFQTFYFYIILVVTFFIIYHFFNGSRHQIWDNFQNFKVYEISDAFFFGWFLILLTFLTQLISIFFLYFSSNILNL